MLIKYFLFCNFFGKSPQQGSVFLAQKFEISCHPKRVKTGIFLIDCNQCIKVSLVIHLPK